VRRRTKYLLVTCILLPFLCGWWLVYPPVCSDVPTFSVSWPSRPSRLLLKVDARTGNLLVKSHEAADGPDHPDAKRPPFYLYDRSTRKLAEIPYDAWTRSDGLAFGYYNDRFPGWAGGADIKDGQLSFAGNAIATAGRHAQDIAVSPNGNLIAVLSANGWKRPYIKGLLPWYGGSQGGGVTGQHYVEFFALPRLEPDGRPVRIPLRTTSGIRRGRWSANGEYIAYMTEGPGQTICIIDVNEVVKGAP